MSEHTKEPWRCADRSPSFDAVVGDDGTPIFEYSIDDDGLHFKPEDALRIVACVNACAGIQTETLQGDEPMTWYITTLRNQRDKLLAALKEASAEFKKLPHSLGYDITNCEKYETIIAEVEAGK